MEVCELPGLGDKKEREQEVKKKKKKIREEPPKERPGTVIRKRV
jgi:hypothetical protein